MGEGFRQDKLGKMWLGAKADMMGFYGRRDME